MKLRRKKITYLPTLFFSDLVSGNTAILLGLMPDFSGTMLS